MGELSDQRQGKDLSMPDIDKQLVAYLSREINSKKDFLDFKKENTNYATHGYHDYPATMIPQLPKLFIEAVEKFQKIENVYDPFSGSGTTLVEARLHGLNSVGVDLNPLAVLMGDVKTKVLDDCEVESVKCKLYNDILSEIKLFKIGKSELIYPTFKNIDYWFKDYVIIDLQIIKNQITKIQSKDIRNFFLLAFSATTRYVSNTRNNEFKMYRMAPNKLAKWHPDVIKKFFEFAERNIAYNKKCPKMTGNVKVIFGSSSSVPEIADNSFDLLITSPPYGDSKTTVAYGQFSRTSLQWLDLDIMRAESVPKLDSKLLGGRITFKELRRTGSTRLDQQLTEIAKVDMKRALEVSQFYQDLYETLKEIKRVMKPGSFQFWVTANRTVKGIRLTTDEIITELFATLDVQKIAEYNRHIPNKRMPSKNSPSNIKGNVVTTMNKENIVVYKTGVGSAEVRD
ncbi:DNA methyltransferase [Lacticaseibacillus paracasei]|uniref:DNA methyltransferase n=1 Tax=Lacticaseibacillus paracasei TaxID=1597 RepID=UPI0022EC6F2D|nr:DNA methyltransferase [Lacticaseibacillus paracasei]WBS98157.1 DNA methyltransferase [Lacticaseibacillus paracasei]